MRTLGRVLDVMLPAVLSVRLLLCVILLGLGLVLPGDVTYPEGALIYAVRRVAAGQPLYRDFRSLPHITVDYGPTFFYIAGVADRFWGKGAFGSYVVSRSVSLTGIVLLMVLCGCWATELAGSRTRGALIAALAAASPSFWLVSVSARVDSLALLASYTSLWVASRRWSPWRWVFVWLLTLLAWTCKQSTLAIGPALAMCLFQTRGLRAALAWTFAWASGIAGLWGIFHCATHGLFTLNAITAMVRAPDWDTGLAILRDSAVHVAPILLLALWRWRRSIASEQLRWPAWCFAFASAQSLVPIFCEGGGVNHLLEPWVAACLLIVPLLSVTDGVRWLLVIGLLAISANDAVYFLRRDKDELWWALHAPPLIRNTGEMPRLFRLVSSAPGAVFIEYSYLAFITERPPEVLDVLHYRQIVDRGLVRGELLANRFAEHRYSLVVLREAVGSEYDETKLMRWPRPVWSAIQSNYQLAMILDDYYVYLPITPAPRESE